MNFKKQFLLIPIFSVVCGAQATTPLLVPYLNSQTIYSGAAITSGADSIIGGNLRSIAATTLGAGSEVGSNLEAGAAITLGASAKVGGDVLAGIAITLGDRAMVGGSAQSLTGPITLGANAVAFDSVTAGTSITLSANAIVGGATTPWQLAYSGSDSQRTQLERAQVALNNMPLNAELAATMTEDTTLQPGVYHATALTTTAGITITLDGNPLGSSVPEPGFWVFNIDSYMAFGANTKVKLVNVHPDSTIVWNTGGYTTLGSGSHIVGAIIAGSYITTGAGTSLTGVDNACGGIFTTVGAVKLGAGSTMGGIGCTVGAVNNFFIDAGGTAVFESSPTDPSDCFTVD